MRVSAELTQSIDMRRNLPDSRAMSKKCNLSSTRVHTEQGFGFAPRMQAIIAPLYGMSHATLQRQLGASHTFFCYAATERKTLQLMISNLRLFSRQHLMTSRALASTFDQRHSAGPKNRMRRMVTASSASAEKKIIETGSGNTNEPRIEQEQY